MDLAEQVAVAVEEGAVDARATGDGRDADLQAVLRGLGQGSEGAQLQEAHSAAGGEAVGAQDSQPGDGQGSDPGGGGFPGGLTAAGKAAREQGRFTQSGQRVMGEAGFAGGARAGVQGDPAGRRVVGSQGGVGVDRVVMAVDDHGDGRRWRGEGHGGGVVRRGG
ncbi:hypothetical protein [Streptomyces antimycoticus]|uniref:hypothetical protein n=1 Tax=Streptomyces antimycoticus TaxID=68175 RepID=UPI00138702D2|nr:hypothetical protein [Streptomyces antimycoticus]